MIFALLSSTLWALPVGNCLTPAIYSNGLWDQREPYFSWGACTHLRFGYYGDFVFERKMEQMISGNPGSDIAHFGLATNAGTLTLDICDYLDGYLLCGATSISYQAENEFQEYCSFDFSTSTCWSIGGALDLWQYRSFGVGIEGQYFETRPLFNRYTNYATGEILYFNDRNQMKWREWQGGLTATFRMTDQPNFVFAPYMGVKAASGKLRQHGFEIDDGGLIQNLNLLESKEVWGFAIGVTVVSYGIMGVTAEGRFGDEKAFYTNFQMSY